MGAIAASRPTAAADAGLPSPQLAVRPAPEYDALFRCRSGWTGADCAYSVPLSERATLWLFGDTWVGEIRGGRHVDATMVNNSVAVQHGKDPATASVEFFYGREKGGKPAALVTPADGRGFFWLMSGIRTPPGIILIAAQIEKLPGGGVFAFKQVGQWMLRVANPDDRPTAWRIMQQKIPHFRSSAEGATVFGAAELAHDGFVYVYGFDEEIQKPFRVKHMVVARAAGEDLGRPDQWRFYAGGRWQPDFTRAKRLIPHVASEYSVSYQPSLKRFVVVYTQDGFSPKILVRTASSPVGPWSDPAVVYECPEAKWHKTVFCYAAKAHPELSTTPGELIVSYVANSTDFWHAAADARLYWPTFVRVRFVSP